LTQADIEPPSRPPPPRTKSGRRRAFLRLASVVVAVGLVVAGVATWLLVGLGEDLDFVDRVRIQHAQLLQELERIEFPAGYTALETTNGGCLGPPLICDDGPPWVGRTFEVVGHRGEEEEMLVSLLEEQRFELTDSGSCVDTFRRSNLRIQADFSPKPGLFASGRHGPQCPKRGWERVYAKVFVEFA
jgi:hypothetical protein